MADNTQLDSGSGGDLIATDDISGVKHQRVKVQYGDDGSATDASKALPLPVHSFEMLAALGLVTGTKVVHKFGRNLDVDTASEDVHDAGGTWVAPTQARLHDVASDNSSDDGSPGGVGARTVRVFGLTSWSTAETSEDITLDGTNPVTTSNSYVIIHRMRVLTKGTSGPNVGTITATAQVDGTVTAEILPAAGQTQMAVYGVPSGKTLAIEAYYASTNRGGPDGALNFELLWNPEPAVEITTFITKHTLGLVTDGSSYVRHDFHPPLAFSGPGILKIRADGSTNNFDVSAGFDGCLVDDEGA